MKKYLLLFLIQLIINISIQADIDRPSLYGFAQAYPVEVPELFSSEVKPPYLIRESQFIILLHIDNNGKVTTITPINEEDSRIGEYLKIFLTNCRFQPALLNNKKSSSILPVIIIINPRIKTPDFYFPIDSKLNIKDPDLYYMTFQHNGITLPSVKYFPKYFCNIDWNDSLDIYPFVLLQLDLDKGGEVKNVTEVLSTYSNYTTTLMSASLWSEFKPAKINDSNISCSPFLLVSLFPQIYYPTRKFYYDKSDSLSIHEKIRVKLIPDSVSILQKPIPRNFDGENISIPNIPIWLNDTLSFHITVDTSGYAQLNRFGKTDKETYKILQDVYSRMKFYPAIGFDGKPVEYSGFLRLIIKGSEKVRIQYLW